VKIKIQLVGKIENHNYSELSTLYLGRIKHYLPIGIEFVKSEKISSLSSKEIISREGNKLLKKLSQNEYVCALDRKGKNQSSQEFALFFQSLQNQSKKQITFVIGGPLGLSDMVLKRANSIVSLSKMTFAHELSAIIILEQIYRTMNILHGGKYHK
jgi:23S rRNA (pseudouridine1915-N3)-methyltransferase